MDTAFMHIALPWKEPSRCNRVALVRCSAVQTGVEVQRKQTAVRAHAFKTRTQSQLDEPWSSKFDVVTHDNAGTRPLSFPLVEGHRPILVFIPGLDSRPLPQSQVERVSDRYRIISMCHARNDRSDWESLVRAAASLLFDLRTCTSSSLTLLGESFGAALALRLVASLPPELISRLILINPGTAILHDPLLHSITSFLPLLKLDLSDRILYNVAAAFLFNVVLTRRDHLDPKSVSANTWPIPPSFDTNQVPLDATLHRVALLQSFGKTFTDNCITRLVQVPTVLVASGRDRLLRSRSEIERLARLLSRVERKIVLRESGHAALLERNVNLLSILETTAPQQQDTNAGRTDTSFEQKEPDEAFQSAIRLGARIFAPWRQAVSPKVYGAFNLRSAVLELSKQESTQRPVLLVGNHTVFGLLDVPLLFMELAELLPDIRFSSLAHPAHFKQYGKLTGGRWTRFVTDLGAKPASARNYYRLLADGERILLFPGGAREVCRRRGERYKLFWKNDSDFVRPAAKFNALIVPFSAVGADDAVDIVVDGQELQQLPILGDRVRSMVVENGFELDNVMPIASFPPRIDRFYFSFGDPIDTAVVDHRDQRQCKLIYQEVRQAVENGIQNLQRQRDQDPKRTFAARLLSPQLPTMQLRSLLEGIQPTFDL